MGDIFDAIQQGDIKTVGKLLKRNSKLSNSDTPLNSINHPNKFSSTPLMIAALSGTKYSNEIFQLLLEYGARSDLRDNDGYTVAHFTIKYGNAEKLRMLIEYDTECFLIPDNQGRLPVDILDSCSEYSSDIDELKQVLLLISQPNFAECYKAEPAIDYKVTSKKLSGSLKNINRYNEKFNNAILDAGYRPCIRIDSRCSNLSLDIELDLLMKGIESQNFSSMGTHVSRVDASALTYIAYGMRNLNKSIELMKYIEKSLSNLSYESQLMCIYLLKEMIVSDLEGDILHHRAFKKIYQNIWLQIDTKSSEILPTLKEIMDKIIYLRKKYNQKSVQFLNVNLNALEADILLPHTLNHINLNGSSEDSDIILIENDFEFAGFCAPLDFAENIYLLDKMGYLALTKAEFSSKNKTLLSDFQNLLANKVRYDILSADTTEDKCRVINFYCDVANILLNKYKDQQGFLSVVTGLSIVTDKMMNYLLLSRQLRERVIFLQAFISPFGNFRCLREHLEKNNNALPAFQILLSDIAHLMDAGLGTVEKAKSLGKLLLPISMIKDALASQDLSSQLLSDSFRLKFYPLIEQVSGLTESDINALRDLLRKEIEQATQQNVAAIPVVPPLDFTPLFDSDSAQSSSRSWLKRKLSSKPASSPTLSPNKESRV